MRAAHHLHGVFEVTPLPGFAVLALGLAFNRVAGGAGDRLKAVLLQHLPRDAVDLGLGNHRALPCFAGSRRTSLAGAPRLCRKTRCAESRSRWFGFPLAAPTSPSR